MKRWQRAHVRQFRRDRHHEEIWACMRRDFPELFGCMPEHGPPAPPALAAAAFEREAVKLFEIEQAFGPRPLPEHALQHRALATQRFAGNRHIGTGQAIMTTHGGYHTCGALRITTHSGGSR